MSYAAAAGIRTTARLWYDRMSDGFQAKSPSWGTFWLAVISIAGGIIVGAFGGGAIWGRADNQISGTVAQLTAITARLDAIQQQISQLPTAESYGNLEKQLGRLQGRDDAFDQRISALEQHVAAMQALQQQIYTGTAITGERGRAR